MKILLTGASGFVGSALLAEGEKRQLNIRPVFRSETLAKRFGDGENDICKVQHIDSQTNWTNALNGVDVVVHCAARVHVMHDIASNPLAEFRKVNVEGTLNLARQAAKKGVRRFVFVSSIKVNGEGTHLGRIYTAEDDPAPEDAYGVSKAEAEAGLLQIAQTTGLELVILRPPLVYGPGVKGNFSNLINLVSRGIPLPLGRATRNRRSLVALDNFVDLIFRCVDHPKAANQIFLVSDGEDVSTAELLEKIGKALDRPARLLPIPIALLNLVVTIFGKRALSERLLGSLQVDISKARQLLDWSPRISLSEGLRLALEKRVKC